MWNLDLIIEILGKEGGSALPWVSFNGKTLEFPIKAQKQVVL
jgi:hypothetical protein